MPNIFRPKSDERKSWRALKAKHAKALKDKKISFKQDLGKAMDKQSVIAQKDYKNDEQKAANIKAEQKQGQEVKKIADDYLVRIKGMGNPAEKALTDELNKIIKSATFWDFMKF